MMDRKGLEFEATVDAHGRIRLPVEAARSVGKHPVHVRLTARTLNSELKKRGVNEDEIERISTIQLEPREQVVKFLLSEGSLNERSRRRRSR